MPAIAAATTNNKANKGEIESCRATQAAACANKLNVKLPLATVAVPFAAATVAVLAASIISAAATFMLAKASPNLASFKA